MFLKYWTEVEFCCFWSIQGSAPPLSPSSMHPAPPLSPAPPFSAGPYGPGNAPISMPLPVPTVPVHQLTAQEISEENYRESIWKDFPPLQLPPVHLPIPVRQMKSNNGHTKVNGHGHGPTDLHFTVGSPGKSGQASTYHQSHGPYPGQYTVVDEAEDHPGRRKSSGFLQPMKHLSGRTCFDFQILLFAFFSWEWIRLLQILNRNL